MVSLNDDDSIRPIENRFSFGKPVPIRLDSVTVPTSCSSFIPIQRIKCETVKAPVKIQRRNLVAVVFHNSFLR